MHFSIPAGAQHGTLHTAPASSDTAPLVTLTAPRKLTRASIRSSLIATADAGRHVHAVRLGKDRRAPASFLELRKGVEVLAMEVCGNEVVIATRERGQTTLEVFNGDDGRLRHTLPSSLHRTPPHSLTVSPSSLVASISPSELLLFDPAADWRCMWALRGPAPHSAPPSADLLTALWLTASGARSPSLLTAWRSGELCLWEPSWVVSKSIEDTMNLTWRVVPPPSLVQDFERCVAASVDGRVLVVTAPGLNAHETNVLVWDVEERALSREFSLPVDAVFDLHVLEANEEEVTCLMRSRSILYHVLVPLLAREPSIRLVREGVDQIVSAENGRLVTLESGRLVIRDLETTLHGDETFVGADHFVTERLGSPMQDVPLFASFDLDWLQPSLDDRTFAHRVMALRSYLHFHEKFPPEHRLAAYAMLLRCPSSPAYFQLISAPEDRDMMRAFRAAWDLSDLGDQARMEGIIHLLASLGFSRAALVERIPPLVHPLVTFAGQHATTSDRQLFEVVLSLLLRQYRVLWDETAVAGGLELWRVVEELMPRDQEKLQDTNVVLSKLFSSVSVALLTEVKAGPILDAVVARPPRFFACLVAAVAEMRLFEREFTATEHIAISLQPSAVVRRAMELERTQRGSDVANRLASVPGFSEGAYLDASYQLVLS